MEAMNKDSANKGFQATAHKLSLCNRFRTLQSYMILPVGRRLNPDVGIEKMMKKNRITILGIAGLVILVGLLIAYGAIQIECPYCHNADGNIKGNCVLRQRTGTCSEDYYAQHNNKSNCPWCGARGHMSRFETWKD